MLWTQQKQSGIPFSRAYGMRIAPGLISGSFPPPTSTTSLPNGARQVHQASPSGAVRAGLQVGLETEEPRPT